MFGILLLLGFSYKIKSFRSFSLYRGKCCIISTENRHISLLLEKLSPEVKCNFVLVKLECDSYQQVHGQKGCR